MGDDIIDNDKIVYSWSPAGPGDYIDAMLALGWLPCLVINGVGEATVFERYPVGAGIEAVAKGYAVSAWWMASPERYEAVAQALRNRGMIRHL